MVEQAVDRVPQHDAAAQHRLLARPRPPASRARSGGRPGSGDSTRAPRCRPRSSASSQHQHAEEAARRPAAPRRARPARGRRRRRRTPPSAAASARGRRCSTSARRQLLARARCAGSAGRGSGRRSPESATATMDQKLIATSPPTLNELCSTTNSGPRMPSRMWTFSQFRSGPRPRSELDALARGVQVHDRHHHEAGHRRTAGRGAAGLERPVVGVARALVDRGQVIGGAGGEEVGDGAEADGVAEDEDDGEGADPSRLVRFVLLHCSSAAGPTTSIGGPSSGAGAAAALCVRDVTAAAGTYTSAVGGLLAAAARSPRRGRVRPRAL